LAKQLLQKSSGFSRKPLNGKPTMMRGRVSSASQAAGRQGARHGAAITTAQKDYLDSDILFTKRSVSSLSMTSSEIIWSCFKLISVLHTSKISRTS
jgi:hypothetical protein